MNAQIRTTSPATGGLSQTGRWISRGVFAAIAVGFVLLGWNQIARNLAEPVYTSIAVDSERYGLPTPSGGQTPVDHYWVNDVQVQLNHISTQLQWMMSINTALQIALIAAVFLSVYLIWIRTLLGRPFARSMTRVLGVLAVFFAVVGTGSESLSQFIGRREAFEVLGINHAGPYYSNFEGFQYGGPSIIAALGIAVVAGAFAVGAHLAKETDGLV